MRATDWKMMSYIGIALGIVFLFGGFVAYGWVGTYYIYGIPMYSAYVYRDYAIPLLILGIVFLVVGVAGYYRAEEERKLELPEPKVSLKKCPKCGTEFREEYGFCPYCQVKLEST